MPVKKRRRRRWPRGRASRLSLKPVLALQQVIFQWPLLGLGGECFSYRGLHPPETDRVDGKREPVAEPSGYARTHVRATMLERESRFVSERGVGGDGEEPRGPASKQRLYQGRPWPGLNDEERSRYGVPDKSR